MKGPTVSEHAEAALSRLVDQAYNTAGDDPGRARVMEDFRVVAEALTRVTPPEGSKP